jgi:hypothetical protein
MITVRGSASGASQKKAVELVAEATATWQPPVRATTAGDNRLFCAMTDGRVSIATAWVQGIYNDVGEQAYISIREFSGALVVPGERLMYAFEPTQLKEYRFLVELRVGGPLAWKERGKSELLTTEDLAGRIATAFFDLVGRANRGKVKMPFV